MASNTNSHWEVFLTTGTAKKLTKSLKNLSSCVGDCNGIGTHNHIFQKQTLNQNGHMVELLCEN